MFTFEIACIIVIAAWLFTSVFVESGTYFTIGVVITAIFATFVFTLPVMIAFIINNLNIIILGAVAYFIIGGIWSIFSWWRLNVKVKNLYDEYKTKWPNMKVSELTRHIGNDLNNNKITLPPSPSQMKSNITLWISAWPISIITWIIGDLVVEVCNAIYNMLGGIYTRITTSIFGDNKFEE